MDKRVFALGITMLVVGFVVYGYLNETEPTGKADMTDQQKSQLNQDLIVNIGLRNIAALVGGIGFFITLISIGIKSRKRGGLGKPVTQKPSDI